ncbi:MAG: molybdopterin-guanine dinucleotide biosynthesis protein B [Candidatus Bathyarchaeota archaeon]|nr:molybdopterin-guanine dinucleotide biosynthesis protein B [Candidatus Bathyarchaeota archaeon]
MRVNCPMLAVIGRKASGKTAVIETLVPQLIKEGFSVASVKHIAHENFSIDREGSDTWRHWKVGANPVIAFSRNEVDIMIKARNVPLEEISKAALSFGANVVILEGFSSMVLGERGIGKIVCVRSLKEYDEFREHIKHDLIAFCSLQDLGAQILNIKSECKILVEKTLNFIKKRAKIIEILNSLARLDCGRCGRNTCEELAEEIYYGNASVKDCVVMEMRNRLNTKVTVRGEDVPLQPFTSEFIRRTILAMVSSLKNVEISGDESVHVNISK